jgi:hypothetical protein
MKGLPALALAWAAAPAFAGTIDVDALAVTQQRNVVQIPNDAQGTRFSLVDVLGRDPQPAGRVTVVFGGFRDGQQWRLVAAPLTLSGDGTLASATDFNGASFAPGPVSASYTFNSYRATYRWKFYDDSNWSLYGGITAKVRDAEIALEQNGISSSKQNTGLVPLLHLAGEATYGNWRVSLDGDALASPQGRAIDVGARAGYALTSTMDLFAGLRVIEGGGDNDEVYNFAMLTQWSIGLRARF